MMTIRQSMKSTSAALIHLAHHSHASFNALTSRTCPYQAHCNFLNSHFKLHNATKRAYINSSSRRHLYNTDFPIIYYSTSYMNTYNILQRLRGNTLLEFTRKCQYRYFHISKTSPCQVQFVCNDTSQRLGISFGMSTLTVPFIWLRDHCRSEKCYNGSTFQKIPDAGLLQRDLVPVCVEYTSDKLGVNITWKDGHVSKFTFEFIINNFYPGQINGKTQRLLWDKAVVETEGLPSVLYNEHVMTEFGLRQTLANLIQFGFTLVKEAPASIEGVQAVVKRICLVEEGIFGTFWTFTSDGSRGDSAYSNERLGAHTDSSYMNSPYGIQVFQCLEHAGFGGETFLVDGFHAIEILRTSDPAAFQILNKTVVPHEYKESRSASSPGYHLYSLGTVISTHPISGEPLQIRYNPYDRAPLNTVRPDNIQSFYEAYDSLSTIIQSPGLELWVKLRPGEVLLVDNWRVLHGRSEFGGKRVMCGCYLPRDLWTSKARLIGVL